MGIIHSFNRKLLWTYYVPGTVLGMWIHQWTKQSSALLVLTF